MVWFAFVASPHGTSVRVKKRVVVSLDCDPSKIYDEAESLSRLLSGKVEVVKSLDVNTLYEIAELDPDLLDVAKKCIEAYAIMLRWT